jgi:hypothetical protein
MNFYNKTIEDCFMLASSGGYSLFGMFGHVCALIDSMPVSTEREDKNSCNYQCSDYSSVGFGDYACGGNSSYSLYSIMRTAYVGTGLLKAVLNHSIALQILETVPSGYPSILQCYTNALLYGYKYFGINSGVDCIVTNDELTADSFNATTTMNNATEVNTKIRGSLVIHCTNGDPCGSVSSLVAYQVTDINSGTPSMAPIVSSSNISGKTPLITDFILN